LLDQDIHAGGGDVGGVEPGDAVRAAYSAKGVPVVGARDDGEGQAGIERRSGAAGPGLGAVEQRLAEQFQRIGNVVLGGSSDPLR
jgi:hypothetical protein